MIIPQPVGGVGVSGGGAWAQAVARPPPGPAPCTLSVSGLARVAPSGNIIPLVTSQLVSTRPRGRVSDRASADIMGADGCGPASGPVSLG